jgi:hypothetical protein
MNFFYQICNFFIKEAAAFLKVRDKLILALSCSWNNIRRYKTVVREPRFFNGKWQLLRLKNIHEMLLELETSHGVPSPYIGWRSDRTKRWADVGTVPVWERKNIKAWTANAKNRRADLLKVLKFDNSMEEGRPLQFQPRAVHVPAVVQLPAPAAQSPPARRRRRAHN